jgi:putative peptide maturation dehydrogenase
MHLKRPHILLVERREQAEFSLDSLLAGGAGVQVGDRWIALAPHLGVEVLLELEDLAVLDAAGDRQPTPRVELYARFGHARVDALVEAGLLIGDHAAHDLLRERDHALADAAWWHPAAVVQGFGRWRGVDVESAQTRGSRPTLESMVEQHGLPPSEVFSVRPDQDWMRLPAPGKTALDGLLASRTTCRNFDAAFQLPLATLSSMLHRVFGVQASLSLGSGAVALKKNSPSGGGLHPVEAFLLAQRVEGAPAGLYHYQANAHALEPMRLVDSREAAELARELVAGQSYFAQAPVLIVMAARFVRSNWKYRNHAKAWKVAQLDAGHLSQNLYLSATEMGLGAFVTAAMNDECAERCFEFDGMATGAIVVCGIGRRAGELSQVELDPLGLSLR